MSIASLFAPNAYNLYSNGLNTSNLTDNITGIFNGSIVDHNGSSGLASQVLESTGAGQVQWVNPGGGGGGITTGNNNGTGDGIYQDVTGSIMNFKSLVAGSGITLVSNPDDITIESNGGSGITNGNNNGAGSGVFQNVAGNTMNFKSLVAGSGISLTNNTNDITITNSGGSGGITNGNNNGSGSGVFQNVVGSTMNFKSLVAGSGISLTNNANDITITNNGGGGTGVFPTVYVTTSNYTAPSMNTKYVTNFQSGTMIFNLPDVATNGDEIVISNISSNNGIQINPGGAPSSRNLFLLNNGTSTSAGALVNFANGIFNSTIGLYYLVTNQTNNYWIIKYMTSPYYDPTDVQWAGLHALNQLSDTNISSTQNRQALVWTGAAWQNQTLTKEIFYNAYGVPRDGQFMGYVGINTDESKTWVLCPRNLTVTQISISMNAGQTPGKFWVYTLRRNGTNTSFVCQVGNVGITQFTGSETFVAGDLMSIGITTIGTGLVTPSTNTLTISYLI